MLTFTAFLNLQNIFPCSKFFDSLDCLATKAESFLFLSKSWVVVVKIGSLIFCPINYLGSKNWTKMRLKALNFFVVLFQGIPRPPSVDRTELGSRMKLDRLSRDFKCLFLVMKAQGRRQQVSENTI